MSATLLELPVRSVVPEIIIEEKRDIIATVLSTAMGPSLIFNAFRRTTEGTDLRVGRTEIEDPDTITGEQVQDYINGFLAAQADVLAETIETNGYDSEQAAFEVYMLERYEFYNRLVHTLLTPTAVDDTLVA